MKRILMVGVACITLASPLRAYTISVPDNQVCRAGQNQLFALTFDLAKTVKGNNSMDTGMLISELFGRRNHAFDMLSHLIVENTMLAMRGKPSDVTCAEAVEQAIAYVKGE